MTKQLNAFQEAGIQEPFSFVSSSAEMPDIIEYKEFKDINQTNLLKGAETMAVDKIKLDVDVENGVVWYELSGTDYGTGFEFNKDEYGMCEDGTIVNCDSCPLTVGDYEHIAVLNSID